MKRNIDLKKIILPALMVILAVLLILCMLITPGKDPEKKQKTFYDLFDTVGTVLDYSGDTDEKFDENYQLVYHTLRYYNDIFDIYNDRENVVGIYEINKNAGIAPVEVPTELIDFLEFCKEVHALTGGEVNVAMGAVLSLWHECRMVAAVAPASAMLPEEESLIEAAKHCDINKLIINRADSTVYLEDKEMSLDVGAIGKGYAVEMAAKKLSEVGADGYVLDVGGNLRIIGAKPSGDGFKIGIKDPFGNAGVYVKILVLKNTSSVTSGGYERYYTVGDKKYHHIIDKDTLYPSEKFASVTVITEDSGLADVLSTALFCMSEEEGVTLVESLSGVEAVWVKNGGEVICSSGIEGFIK